MNRIGGQRMSSEDFHRRMEDMKNAPLFFIPTAILCHCGQRVMIAEENHTPPDLYVVVSCTHPFCSEYQKDKKINLPEFRNYQVLS